MVNESNILITHNTINDIRIWHISLEMKKNELYKIHTQDDPFIGTPHQKDCYCEMIAETAQRRGMPLKKIHVMDCGKASLTDGVTKQYTDLTTLQ